MVQTIGNFCLAFQWKAKQNGCHFDKHWKTEQTPTIGIPKAPTVHFPVLSPTPIYRLPSSGITTNTIYDLNKFLNSK